MRDVLLTLLVAGLLPVAVLRPFAGLLVFSWLAYFRPQELCWTFARELPFSMAVGVAIVAGIVAGRFLGAPFSREPRPVRPDPRTTLLVLFLVATGLAGLFAVRPAASAPRIVELSKIVFVALLATGLCRSRRRIRLLLLVIAFSLGAMALKHALFAVRTGELRIFRGPGGMMADNNDFGLALVMAIPLLVVAVRDERSPWVRAVAWLFGISAVATIFFTHSRSGLVALAVVGLLAFVKLAGRARTWLAAPVLVVAAVLLLPADVLDRIEGVRSGRPDDSVRLRVVAWEKAARMAASRPVFGVGPGNFTELWSEWPPASEEGPIVVHNTFLQVFAEGGLVGLLLLSALLVSAVAGLVRVRRRVRDDPAERWRVATSHALELSIVGFAAGAMFLTRVNFDLFYQLVGVVPALLAAGRGS